MSPVEFKFVGVAVFVKLAESFGECRADFRNVSAVRINEFAVGVRTIFGRKLMYFERYIFAVAHESEIEFFRVAIPMQNVFRRGVFAEQSGQNPQQFGQRVFVRRVRRRRVKFALPIAETDGHPTALRRIKTDFQFVCHNSQIPNSYGNFKLKFQQTMKQYQDLLRHILHHGTTHEDRTGVGTISVFGYQNRYDLRSGFPMVTTKKVPFRWIAEELFWFLSGDTNEKNLQSRGVDIWAEWADAAHTAKFGRDAGDLGPVYGYLWRSFGGDYPRRNGSDQIKDLIAQIAVNPNSRRLIVSGWNPETAVLVDLPPCHTLFQFKIEGEKILHCQLYQRSADAFLGVPFNISSYALLTHLIAHVCGLQVGEFVHTFGDLHIYSNHLAQVEELLTREPLALPQLVFQNAENLRGLDGLLNFGYENLRLENYVSHGKIAAPVAV